MPASDASTLANVVNLYLGVGILSLPWSFAGASLLGGMLIMGVGVLWCAVTNVILVAFAERTQQFSLGNMLGALPGGRFWQPFGTLVLLGTNFLCLVGYLIVFADNFNTVVLQAMLGYNTQAYTRLLLIAAACMVVFPLSLLDQSRLSFTSIVSVVANWFICFNMIKEVVTADMLSEVCVVGYGTGDATMIACVMMAVSFTQCILPVYEEMANRRVGRFIFVQVIAVVIALVLLSVVAVSGYLLYGASVSSNVLLELPQTAANLLAQALIIPVVIGTYPLQMYPINIAFREVLLRSTRQPAAAEEPLLLEDPEASPLSETMSTGTAATAETTASVRNTIGKQGLPSMYVLRVVIITCSGLVAAVGFDLGPVNNIAGILGLGWNTVVMPFLCCANLLRLKKATGVLPWSLLAVHLLVGSVLTVMTMVYTGNHLESLEQNCAWWWSNEVGQ